MRDITKKILTITAGLGLLALTALPLNAQKHGDENYCSPKNSKIDGGKNNSNKENYSYSLSKECKNYNKNVYHKSTEGKPVFLNKDARHYNKKVYANRMHDDFKGISGEDKKLDRYLRMKEKMKR